MNSILVIIYTLVGTCVQATEVTTDSSVAQYDYLCQPWYTYNPFDGSCTCTKTFHTSYSAVKCSQLGAIIPHGFCTTYNEGTGTLLARCLYFQSKGLNLTSDGYTLPHNITELNDYMCGSMNRMNSLCSDCIDGYGPSFTSLEFQCSNCIGVWYGVPLYLLVELGPITLLYLVIVVFHVSMTSAPLTGYIMYSQTILYELIYDRTPPIRSIVVNQSKYTTVGVKVILALYGVWSLDPIRYLVPPFCISAKLKTTHIALLGYVSIFYPLCLIFLTWLCTELHGRNFKLLVVCWRPIHRFIVRLRHGLDVKTDLVSVFASFFALLYNKLLYQSMSLLSCQELTADRESKNRLVTMIDPSIGCLSIQHLMVAIPALIVLLFCVIVPSILFLLYSTRTFRACLTKCRVSGPYLATINMFMEKYHSCCRDSLNGGRDMRIFAGFYFITRVLITLYYILVPQSLSISFWTYQTVLFSSAALVIALVKPYKRIYMNILDTLQLAIIALLCHLLSQKDTRINLTLLFVLCILPAAGFALYNILIRTERLRRRVFNFFKRCCRKVAHPDMHRYIQDHNYRTPLNVTNTSVTVGIPNYQSINE